MLSGLLTSVKLFTGQGGHVLAASEVALFATCERDEVDSRFKDAGCTLAHVRNASRSGMISRTVPSSVMKSLSPISPSVAMKWPSAKTSSCIKAQSCWSLKVESDFSVLTCTDPWESVLPISHTFSEKPLYVGERSIQVNEKQNPCSCAKGMSSVALDRPN